MKIVGARSKTGVRYARQADGSFLKALPAGAGGAVKSFDAANFNRLTVDWQVTRLSADAELQGKLEILRSRSRDGEQNDPFIENYLFLRENNIVGHNGFTLEMKVMRPGSADPEMGKMEPDTPVNLAIERAWRRFCQRKNFLVTRDMHATDACKLIERTWRRDGDLLIRKVKGAPNEFGFALQLLEADYLDDRYIDFRGVPCNCPEERRLPNGMPFPRCERGLHEVRMGVELHGDWKFPVAYWLLANHPGDYFFGNQYATKRIRVPVEEIIHPFTKKRIEQTRGICAAHAALLRFQMLSGMDEAALVRARAGAQKMGVITKEVPDDFQADEEYLTNGLGRTIDGAPGEFIEMPMGFDLKPLDWDSPDNDYAPFQKTQLRGAAAGLGVSYHSLTGDLESVNFSSGRLGHIEQREGFRGGQKSFIANILLEVFPDFLEAAMLSGIAELPWSRFEEFTDHEAVCFHGRGYEFYDPTKDIEYAERAIALGIATRAEFAAEGAKDFEQVTAELKREEEIRTAAGLTEYGRDPTPLSGESVADQIGGKVGTLQAMMAVIEKVPREKAHEALETIFGLTPEMAERVVALLQAEPGMVDAIAEAVPPEDGSIPQSGNTKDAKNGAVKSAFVGDFMLGELPPQVWETVRQFVPEVEETSMVARYGMTVPELLQKADPHNLETARHHLRNAGVRECKVGVLERKDKYVLVMNDRIIDGHHHLAKAEKGKVTSSLAVLDLTPLRFQAGDGAVKATDDGRWRTINGARVHLDDNGNIDKGPAAMMGDKPSEVGKKQEKNESAKPEKKGSKEGKTRKEISRKDGNPDRNEGANERSKDKQPAASESGTAAAGERASGGAERSARDVLGKASGANAAGGGGQGGGAQNHASLYDRNEAERKALGELARKSPELVVDRQPERSIGKGAEHHVEKHGSDPLRVVKHTHAGTYGFTLQERVAAFGGYIELREATPSEYVARMDAMNAVFGDSQRIEGLTAEGGFVVSQRAVEGGEPSAGDVEKFMAAGGYVRVPKDALEGVHISDKTWWNPKTGYVVTDAKPDNFKKDEKGRVIPIDLIVMHAAEGSDMHRVLKTGGMF